MGQDSPAHFNGKNAADFVEFEADLHYCDLKQLVKARIPVPLPAGTDVEEFFSHIVTTQQVPMPFRQELSQKLRTFLRKERLRIEGERDDLLVAEKFNTDVLESPSARQFAIERTLDHRVTTSKLADYFTFIIENSSAERLTFLMDKEIEMGIQMSTLIRARDWELEMQRMECEKVVENVHTDSQPNELSALNEKIREIHESYTNAIKDLAERQREEFRTLITAIYERDEIPRELCGHAGNAAVSGLPPAPSDDLEERSRFDESFTIYLGAQMKTMHNVRLLENRSLLNRKLGDNPSQRLQSSMSIYRRGELHGIILLVDKDPLWHRNKRTEFARLCEHSTELHFDTLSTQLEEIESMTRKANSWRREEALHKVASGESLQTPFDADEQREDGSLLIGDLYLTRHSSLLDVQVVFHLVVDQSIKTMELSSRHPCLAGFRNVIRACARFGITTIDIPLLLSEDVHPEMTPAWCLRRAELVFKCVKGYLMEVCSSGWGSSAPGGPAVTHSPHYNINFTLPAGLPAPILTQITAMFPGIFQLVPAKGL
ncbi:unnamed protein product, partial [Mesorhabditis spiculigera]